jgi:hypothetical protein
MAIEQKLGFLTFAVAIGGMLGIGRLLRDRSAEPPPIAKAAPERERELMEEAS